MWLTLSRNAFHLTHKNIHIKRQTLADGYKTCRISDAIRLIVYLYMYCAYDRYGNIVSTFSLNLSPLVLFRHV